MVLSINRALGWSTSIPSYNPEDIVSNIRRMMKGEELLPMLPWWRGFKGTIKKTGEHKYDVMGVATKLNETTVEITELPIHKWTQNFKIELEAMISDKDGGAVKVDRKFLSLAYRRWWGWYIRITKNITTTSTSTSCWPCQPKKLRKLKRRASLTILS